MTTQDAVVSELRGRCGCDRLEQPCTAQANRADNRCDECRIYRQPFEHRPATSPPYEHLTSPICATQRSCIGMHPHQPPLGAIHYNYEAAR